MHPQIFQAKILHWFADHGRKDLPWQLNVTPYRVWVSEIMLQQTQVTTVIPYYLKFIVQFPDVNSLAMAEIDSVLHLWSGLGYYARARNLHKSARIIYTQQCFPNTLDALMQLPGIGQSTAGAILSIAFNDSQPILDGNVKRVLTRFHAISGWPGESKVNKFLWHISASYTPIDRVAEYTQAMMDLGATICTRSNPKCELCPVVMSCQAKEQGRIAEFPEAKPSKKTPIRQGVFLLLSGFGRQVLLEKRPAIGIWGGLWSLPEFDDVNDAEKWCLGHSISVKGAQILATRRHTFSHYHLDFKVLIVSVESPFNQVMEANRMVWYKPEQINLLGLPAPIKRLLQQYIVKQIGAPN